MNGALSMSTGFGRRLKELRQEAGKSQEDIARAANVSLSAITKLESGKVEPSWPTVRAIAKALSVSVAAFEVEEEPLEESSSPAPEKPMAKRSKK